MSVRRLNHADTRAPSSGNPPHRSRIANGIIQKYFGDQVIDLVPVRLEVKFVDIWAVAEFIKGKQVDLFRDPETVASRLTAFVPERN